MNAKEKWISEVENSLEGLKPAEGNPYLYSKILNRLNVSEKEFVPARLAWIGAASLGLLLLLNLFAISTQSRSSSDKNDLQPLSRDLQLMNTNQINYN